MKWEVLCLVAVFGVAYGACPASPFLPANQTDADAQLSGCGSTFVGNITFTHNSITLASNIRNISGSLNVYSVNLTLLDCSYLQFVGSIDIKPNAYVQVVLNFTSLLRIEGNFSKSLGVGQTNFQSLQYVGGSFESSYATGARSTINFVASNWSFVGGDVTIQGYQYINLTAIQSLNNVNLNAHQIFLPVLNAIKGSATVSLSSDSSLLDNAFLCSPGLLTVNGTLYLEGKANATTNLPALYSVGRLVVQTSSSPSFAVALDALQLAPNVEILGPTVSNTVKLYLALSARALTTSGFLRVYNSSFTTYNISFPALSGVGNMFAVCDPIASCFATFYFPTLTNITGTLTYMADCSFVSNITSVGQYINITLAAAQNPCILSKLTSTGSLMVTGRGGTDFGAPSLIGNPPIFLTGVAGATFSNLMTVTTLVLATPPSSITLNSATLFRIPVLDATTTLIAPVLSTFDGNLAYFGVNAAALPILQNVTGNLSIQKCQNCSVNSLLSVGQDMTLTCDTTSSDVSIPLLRSVRSVSISGCGTTSFGLSMPSVTTLKSLVVTSGGTPDVYMPNLCSANVIDIESTNPSAILSGLTFNSLAVVKNITLTGTIYNAFNAPSLTSAEFINLGNQLLFTLSMDRLANVSGAINFGTNIPLNSLDQILLPALTRVGSIYMVGGRVTKLLMNQLRVISGEVKIMDAIALNTFRMCNLTYVGGTMQFSNVPELSRFDTLAQLQNVTSPVFIAPYSSKTGEFSCRPSVTVTVDTGSCGFTFSCIQEAINITFRRNSDTVLLPAGNYTGCTLPLDLQDREFTLASETPWGAILDCNYTGRAFTLVGTGSVIHGQDLVLKRGNHTNGGLVSATGGAVATCFNCKFLDSIASNAGGALFLETQNKPAAFTACLFEGNTASIGGAVAVSNPSDATPYSFEGSKFMDNCAVDSGGALALISNVSTTSTVNVSGCYIEGNGAAGFGGGVYSNLSAILYGQCRFENNNALQGGGYAIVHDATGGAAVPASISGASFVANTATNGGGGIYAFGLPVAYRSLSLSSNAALGLGGVAPGGGGVLLGGGGALLHSTVYLQFDPASSSFPAPIDLNDVTAIGNWAREGGALRLDAVKPSGGAFTGVRLINNTATTGDGGGAYVTDSQMAFDSVELRGNVAGGSGGGASFRCTGAYRATSLITQDVTISGGSIVNNTAMLNGGGIDATLHFAIGNNALIESNVAMAAGGGIYVALSGQSADIGAIRGSNNNASSYGDFLASDVFKLEYQQPPPASISTGSLFNIKLQLSDAFNNSLQPNALQAFSVSVFVNDTDVQLGGSSISIVDELGQVSFNDLKITATSVGALNLDHVLVTELVGLRDAKSFEKAINITSCIPGQYRVTIDSLVTCPPCPAGTYSTDGQTCLECPYGTTTLPGSAECTPCPLGTYNSPDIPTKQSICVDCQGGQVSSDDRLSCADCPAGTHGKKIGNVTECVPCEIGSVQSYPGQTECSYCAVGSFSFATSNAIGCTPCPANAVCFNSTVTPLTGYQFWSPSQAAGDLNPYPTDFHIVECQVAEYCTGAAYPGCKAGIHRTDYACGACEPTYYMVEQRCTKCPDVSILVIVLTLMVNAVFSVYAVYFQTNTSARIKILVFFGQTMSLILKGVELLPPEVTVLWSVFNLGVEWIPGTCLAPLRFYERLAIPLFTPFLPLVWIGVLYIIETYLLDYQADKRTRPCCFKFLDSLLDTTRRQDRYVKALIFILLFCYTPIMSATFSVLNCVETFPGSGDFRLAADTSYSCLSSQYLLFRTIALIVLLVFVVPFPILLFFATVGLKAKRDLRNLVIRARYGVVYLQYIPELFWWESIMQARKIVVAAIVVLAGSQLASRLLQVFFFSLLLFVQLSLVPFRARSDNRMETAFIVCMLTIAIVLSSGWSNTPVNQRAVGTVPSNTTQALLTAVFLPLVLAAYWHAPLFQACCAKTKAGAACGQCRKSERVTRMAAIFTPVFQDAWNEGGSVYGGDDDRSHDFDEVGRERRRSRLASMGPFDGLDLNDLTDMGPAPSLSLGTSNPLFDNSASNLLPSPISTALPLAPAPPPLSPAPPPPLAPAPPPLLPMASGAPLLPPMPPPVPANQE